MRRQLMAGLVLILLPFGTTAQDEKGVAPKGSPEEAKTTADILKGIEPLKGFGNVSTIEFSRRDQKAFVAWYNPYSGRAASQVHAYRFDAKAEKWVRFLDRMFEGTHDVSVECGTAITIRDVKGQVIYNSKSKD